MAKRVREEVRVVRMACCPPRAVLAAAVTLVATAAAAWSCSGSEPLAPSGSGGSDTGGGGGATVTSSSSSAGAGGGGVDWLHDPELWEPAAPDIPCDIYAAKLPSERVPRRTWTSCGAGCLWAPAWLPGFNIAGFVTGGEIGGDIYYHVYSAVMGDKDGRGANEVARLSDDQPVNLLRNANLCFAQSGLSSPLLFFLHPIVPLGDPSPPAYVGTAATPGAEVVWGLPGFQLPANGFGLFDFAGGWGLVANAGAILVATTPGSSTLETVFSSTGYALSPVGRGPQVAWSDWSDYHPVSHRARIRSWTQAGGSVELAGGDYDVMYVALSDTRMAWIGAYGPSSVDGNTESEQLFWSPRATSPGEVVIHEGPMVPYTEHTSRRLVTHGDWIATTVSSDTQRFAVIVNVATDQLWLVPSRPSKQFGEAIAIDDGSLLLQEDDGDGQYVESLVRLDLTKLDSLVGGLQ